MQHPDILVGQVVGFGLLIGYSLFAWRWPELLNKLIQVAVAVLIAAFMIESILGFLTGFPVLREAHLAGGHIYAVGLRLVLLTSLPACVVHSIRSRSFLGFRQVPSGIACIAVAALLTFTGFLRPDGGAPPAAEIPDADKPALLRFYVLHTFAVPLVHALLLLRWFFRDSPYEPDWRGSASGDRLTRGCLCSSGLGLSP